MNAWLQTLGIDFLKPVAAALLLPPVPWLVLVVLGARALARGRRLGWLPLLAGVALEWASFTSAGADAVARWLLDPPPAFDAARMAAAPGGQTVVVVLGGGRRFTAEYPDATLSPISMQRLRYGVSLSRQTGAPLLFSGGLAPGSDPGPTEADLAERIARDEFRYPLRWAEGRSRDTQGNAAHTVALLRRTEVARVLLVTHDLHMPRALRHFERARDAAGLRFTLLPAPVGAGVPDDDWAIGDYLPSTGGIERTRYALREWLALLAGA